MKIVGQRRFLLVGESGFRPEADGSFIQYFLGSPKSRIAVSAQ